MKVAIIGGGLGGLAVAAGMRKFGMTAEVFERASQFGEVGAGIQISPNAMKALDGVGVGASVRSAGNCRRRTFWLDMCSGEVIKSDRYDGEGGRYGAPYYAFHRADLLEAISSGMDWQSVHFDHEVVGISETADKVVAHFANGALYEADVLIGADGVRSVVRRHLWGDDAPIYTGQMIWRSLIPADAVDVDVLQPDTGGVWLGPKGHAIIYHVRGSQLINVGVRIEAEEWVEESWSAEGDPSEMRATYMAIGEPRIKEVLSKVTRCFKYGIFARNPSTQWGRGRIQLVGDAAHPMLPDAAQGGSQAFEDGYTIARWLAAHRDDPPFALAQYERIRKPRARAIQMQSAINTNLFHSTDSSTRNVRERMMTTVDEEQVGKSFEWIYKHDPVESWNVLPEVPNFGEIDIREVSRSSL